MSTISDRLNRALDDYAPEEIQGDRKAFQHAIRDAAEGNEAVEGTSYPSVLSYMTGKVSPSVAWLEEAAGILGVRVPWLALGQGEPTDAEEDLRRRQVGYEDRRDQVQRLRRQVPDLHEMPYVVTHALLHHLDERDRLGAPDDKDVWTEYIRAPFDEDAVVADWPAFTEYALAMLHALNLALRITTTEDNDE